MRRKSTARRCGGLLAMSALGAIAPFVLASCSSGGGVETLHAASGPTASPLPSAGVSTRAATTQVPSGTTRVLVLRAYTGYWTAQVKALNSGQLAGAGLGTYVTGAALSAANANSFRLTRAGMLMTGQPLHNPVVTALGPIDSTTGSQTATLTDCVDVTGWHQIDAKTHQLQDPAKRLTRYRAVVTARTVGGVWMIS